jgi:hypothetical protein
MSRNPLLAVNQRTFAPTWLTLASMERHPGAGSHRLARGSVAPSAGMAASTADTAAGLLYEAQRALSTSQQGVGRVMGLSRRTIVRWVRHGQPTFTQGQAASLARAVHPHDPALAERIAAAGWTSLAALGIVTPNAKRADAVARARFDAVVCAAAEVLDASPRAVRPALLAAVRRAADVGLTLTDLEAGLAPPESPPAAETARGTRRPPKRVTAEPAP